MEDLRERREFISPMGDAPTPDTTRHDETSRDETRHDATEISDRINELEEENLQLKIDKAGKEYFINQLVRERKETVIQLTEQSRQIGVLETRLDQIEAPRKRRDDEPTDRHTPEPAPSPENNSEHEEPPAGDEAVANEPAHRPAAATKPIEENPDG